MVAIFVVTRHRSRATFEATAIRLQVLQLVAEPDQLTGCSFVGEPEPGEEVVARRGGGGGEVVFTQFNLIKNLI
jgi:hypothetical protein